MTPRTKHIGVKYHFFKSHIGADKGILLVKIDTLLQKGEIFYIIYGTREDCCHAKACVWMVECELFLKTAKRGSEKIDRSARLGVCAVL